MDHRLITNNLESNISTIKNSLAKVFTARASAVSEALKLLSKENSEREILAVLWGTGSSKSNLLVTVEVVDLPFICSKEESCGGTASPSHCRPLRAAEALVEPQLIETSVVK